MFLMSVVNYKVGFSARGRNMPGTPGHVSLFKEVTSFLRRSLLTITLSCFSLLLKSSEIQKLDFLHAF